MAAMACPLIAQRASAPGCRTQALPAARAQRVHAARVSAAAACASIARQAVSPLRFIPSRELWRSAKQTVGCRKKGSVQAIASYAEGSTVADGSVSIVLLSGGVGKRMGASIPKQYLELRGRPIATWSLETFLGMSEVREVVVVCDPSWKYIFEEALARIASSKPVKFALPGAERQDSMANGFKEITKGSALVAIHDSARPLVTAEECRACFQDGLMIGAAVLGVPVKPTIKEIGGDGFVVKTLKRSALWEVQTPQVIAPALLTEGLELVARDNLEVTDDVSIIEALGKPVKITRGAYTNIKVTTPDDMSVAERFLDERAAAVAA